MTWWVRSVRETRWQENELGATSEFDKDGERFPEFGINLTVLQPGQPMTMYHREDYQEGFLILRGECLLVVEGKEVPLRAWDYVHCPSGTAHAIVGAGSGSSLVLAIGSRVGGGGATYPPEPLAARFGASTDDDHDARAAYAKFGPGVDVPCREEFLT